MGWGWLKDKLSDVAEAAWDAATDVADAAADAVGAAASHTGDVIGTVGHIVDTATLGAASTVLNAVDDTLLDGLDKVTGGLIDVDFDDGNLSASVGVDGIIHVGAAVGEDGIRHSSDFLDQSYDLGLTDDGLEVSGEAGIDWGPLPYARGDLTVEADGDVAFDGEIQGTLPTPIGMLSGEAKGGFVRDGDSWGANLDADGTLLLPSGSTVRGGIDASYVDTPEGSALSVGVEGSYTQPGVGTVGGSFGYDRLEVDGVVVEHVEAEGYASGYGVQVQAGVEHTSVETAAGSYSEWDTSADLSLGAAPEPAAPTQLDSAVAAVDSVESSVEEMFSDLA